MSRNVGYYYSKPAINTNESGPTQPRNTLTRYKYDKLTALNLLDIDSKNSILNRLEDIDSQVKIDANNIDMNNDSFEFSFSGGSKSNRKNKTKNKTKNQKGGQVFQNLANLLMPMGKTQLVSLITLLTLNHFKMYGKMKTYHKSKSVKSKSKSQKGGYLGGLERILAPMGHNALVVVLTLLLMDHFISKKNKSKMKGGANANDTLSKNEAKKLLINSLNTKNQSGGSLWTSIQLTVAPMGLNNFTATALLLVLNRLAKVRSTKHKQYGGAYIATTLSNILMPLGVNKFLTTLGLVVLVELKKGKKKKQKGGKKKNIKNMKGGSSCMFGDSNCGWGDDALEVVGDKALNYSNDLTQFGCKVKEWGADLLVQKDGQYSCI